jgi:DNA replicative helicase MCM subunit Mcm2 (Cdc46/Mcm family)
MGGGLRLVVDAITELHAGISQLRCSHVGRLLHVRGTVIRAGAPKVMEASKDHVCTKCKHRFTVRASLAHGGKLKLPRVCPAGREDGGEGDLCPGGKFRPLPETTLLRDYQEVKLQESVHDATGIPRCDAALHDPWLSLVVRGVYASEINRALDPCMRRVQHADTLQR